MPAAIDLPYWSYSAIRFEVWLAAVCLLILFAAAFLYWRRTRHWCLLALTIGSFLAALGMIAQGIGQMPHGDLIPPEMSPGSVQAMQSLITFGMWAVFCGFSVAAVGGVGAIHWAIRLGRRRPNGAE